MNQRITGSILLSASGLTLAIGTVGNQIALAIVKAGFFAGDMTGQIPPGPEKANIHWLVLTAATLLAVLGLYFLFYPAMPE